MEEDPGSTAVDSSINPLSPRPQCPLICIRHLKLTIHMIAFLEVVISVTIKL